MASIVKPIYGEVYTIKEILDHYPDGLAGLVFVEIPDEYGDTWCASRFRPIVKRAYDIDVFKQLLTPVTPKKVSVV